MKKSRSIAVSMFIGFVVAMAVGGPSSVRAHQSSSSPSAAQLLLDREQGTLEQIGPQITQMRHELGTTSTAAMTPTEQLMYKELNDMNAMCRILWQSDTDLVAVMQIQLRLASHHR